MAKISQGDDPLNNGDGLSTGRVSEVCEAGASPSQRPEAMAPYIAALPVPAYHSLPLSDKNGFKLRKPLVEKMRRDRINSCIEQLKSLLETEFHGQDPNAKLEKADILEMTVSFLKRQRLELVGSASMLLDQRDYSQGYSQCWRESVQFLTASSCTGAPLLHYHPQL
ncbi:hairy-related 12 [Engraulis encrasicolus]|uniref:hairy-related 12 n=1 Tax=Engraulis encrasicolus TaxID=184585 RepID=UPI002FD1C9A1